MAMIIILDISLITTVVVMITVAAVTHEMHNIIANVDSNGLFLL
jgi:hypothetical protein